MPPINGHGPYSKILNWIQSKHARSGFVPIVPPSFATPSESKFQNLHRLTYYASGTPASPSPSPRVLKLEIPLESRDPESDADVTDADTKHVLQTSGTPQMWAGCQSEVDVLMPHRYGGAPRLSLVPNIAIRPVDIRLSVQDFSLAPETDLPPVLQQYVAELDS